MKGMMVSFATKAEVADVRTEVEKVRTEVQAVRTDAAR